MFILLTCLVILFILELSNRTSILPNGKFTVPAQWVDAAQDKSSILWGLSLGLGFITYSAGALWHAYLMTMLLLGNWQLGLITGVLYALGRTLLPSFKVIRRKILELEGCSIGNYTYLRIIRQIYSSIIFIIVIIVSLTSLI
ncbi:hypothetical protein [Bacillus sp. V3-13]|uniref:hypothetical protein n=1 Tax=Bacillus sp. V3-13 TaxID=2053728 RepID=UPI000C78D398|nr:hypothetical protein [Bacillus sp. V3-13]